MIIDVKRRTQICSSVVNFTGPFTAHAVLEMTWKKKQDLKSLKIKQSVEYFALFCHLFIQITCLPSLPCLAKKQIMLFLLSIN